MTNLIVVPQAAYWQRLKRLVLDSVSSPITRRVYNLGLDEFFACYGQEPRPGFTKATVSAWRVALEARGLGAVTINMRITAVRNLAVEASDNGLLAPELANGITRVKGVKSNKLAKAAHHADHPGVAGEYRPSAERSCAVGGGRCCTRCRPTAAARASNQVPQVAARPAARFC